MPTFFNPEDVLPPELLDAQAEFSEMQDQAMAFGQEAQTRLQLSDFVPDDEMDPEGPGTAGGVSYPSLAAYEQHKHYRMQSMIYGGLGAAVGARYFGALGGALGAIAGIWWANR